MATTPFNNLTRHQEMLKSSSPGKKISTGVFLLGGIALFGLAVLFFLNGKKEKAIDVQEKDISGSQ